MTKATALSIARRRASAGKNGSATRNSRSSMPKATESGEEVGPPIQSRTVSGGSRKSSRDGNIERVAGPRPQRHQDKQRHEDRARPVGHLGDVKGRPARKQHDFDRHDRDRPPRNLAEQCKQDACEYVAAPRAATASGSPPRARSICGASTGSPAAFKREIGLDRSAEIESAPVEQRPAAVRALDGTNIPGDPRLEFRLDAAEIVLEQDELRRDRHVGLQLEDPMSVGVLQGDQRFAGARNRLVEARCVNATTQDRYFFRAYFIHGRARCRSC